MFAKLLPHLHLAHFYKHISTYIFLFGFVLDSITLPDVSNPTTKYIGMFYISVVSISIFLREFIVSRNTASKIEQKMYGILTFITLITSGALLSFVFIYYTRSAELSVSWPLLLSIIAVMVANEFISTHSFRFLLDISILLIGNIFFFIFNVPLIIDKQNDTIFAISVFLATIAALTYIHLLKYTSEMAKEVASTAQAIAVALPIVIFLLYTTNIMPAVPLSLTDAEIYQDIVRSGGNKFLAKAEVKPRFNLKEFFGTNVYHYEDGNGLYFFSAIHAPAKLEAPISHIWEYYDEEKKDWVQVLKISFPITGGREDGYRAYSQKANLTDGKWRITVKAGEKRIVGRMVFKVEEVSNVVRTNQVEI